MNNKQLAEMIKHLRKVALQEQEQLQELQARSRPTHAYIANKTMAGRKSAQEKVSQPLAGRDTARRYKVSPVVETEVVLTDKVAAKKGKKTGKDTINFEPQQSDTRVF